MTTAGMGGGWGTAAKFVGVDVALNAGLDTMSDSSEADVPLIIAPEHREEYKKQNTTASKTEKKVQAVSETPKTTVETSPTRPQEDQQIQEHPTNQSGWTGLLSSFGLNDLSNIGHNLGYVLAMLPDMIVGAFTGKTQSLGLKKNLMPLASIVAGLFVKNPILKMVLIGMGGLNLLNKAGHEAIDIHKGTSQETSNGTSIRTNYKVYQDEELNERISQPQIKGNCLIATIDRVPCTIALPDKVVDAYNQGALPMNTLANAILLKNDQMRQMASEAYESQQRSETRTLAQR